MEMKIFEFGDYKNWKNKDGNFYFCEVNSDCPPEY